MDGRTVIGVVMTVGYVGIGERAKKIISGISIILVLSNLSQSTFIMSINYAKFNNIPLQSTLSMKSQSSVFSFQAKSGAQTISCFLPFLHK